MFNAANNSSVLNAVSRERLGIASALLSLMRTLGQTTGVPVIASIFALSALGYAGNAQHEALLKLSSESLVRGIHVAFVSAGLIVMVGLVGGVWEHTCGVPGLRRRLRDRSRMTGNRWWQLMIGIVCMSMIANLQYGWTLFVNPLHDKYHWAKAAIQVAFTIFVLTETWLVPIEGYLVDRFGPTLMVAGAGILVGASWVLNSIADSLPLLYVAAAIGGIGAGAVYGTCVGNALKWFPDRRGLAAGLTAMGFGAGSALTVIPIASMIRHSGYEATFLYFGIGQGIAVFALGWLLRQPPASLAETLRPIHRGTAIVPAERTPMQMVRTPVFWILYIMFVLMAAGGLDGDRATRTDRQGFQDRRRAGEHPGPDAAGPDLRAVHRSGAQRCNAPAIRLDLRLDRAREHDVHRVLLEGVGILLLSRFGQDPLLFVILSGLVFFAWGEIYSLFPATCGDTYGAKYASANAGLLYTAKGTAALLIPLTSWLSAAYGGWHAVFVAASVMNAIAAITALVVLKPMRIDDASS